MIKSTAFAAAILLASGLAFAQTTIPGGPGGTPPVVVEIPPETEPGGGGVPPPAPFGFDGDRDGWVAQVDCNDDDPLVGPGAVEVQNGVDDDCNGTVDDSFDTTFDFLAVRLVSAVWPETRDAPLSQHVSTEIPPRIVWAGDRFLVFFVDLRSRLRVASLDADGRSAFTPVTLRPSVNAMDVVWTGSRLAVVLEDAATSGTTSVRLLVLDKDLVQEQDLLIAAPARAPKIAWGQDRFGIVWDSGRTLNNLSFRRFDLSGFPLSPEEELDNSGAHPSIAFDGTVVRPRKDGGFDVHEGRFGVVYEARYEFAVSGDVLLRAFPRAVETEPGAGPVRVNQHADPWSPVGSMPAIVANESGFLVAWHARTIKGKDIAQARYFSHDELAAVGEFVPDADLARYGRLVWTGAEFVMGNDNWTARFGDTFDVHLRRFDATGNTHVTTPRGAWSEVNTRAVVRGDASVHPDLAIARAALGTIWVERSLVLGGAAGQLVFASVTHR